MGPDPAAVIEKEKCRAKWGGLDWDCMGFI